jgi:hypothetical protein
MQPQTPFAKPAMGGATDFIATECVGIWQVGIISSSEDGADAAGERTLS